MCIYILILLVLVLLVLVNVGNIGITGLCLPLLCIQMFFQFLIFIHKIRRDYERAFFLSSVYTFVSQILLTVLFAKDTRAAEGIF